MCHTLMEAISCKDHNSPICLVGNICLKYKHIAEFVNTKQKVLTVNADVARRLAVEGENTIQGYVEADNKCRWLFDL